MNLLRGYRWPGNIRELENVIERGVIVTDTEAIEIDPRWLQPVNSAQGDRVYGSLEEFETHIMDVERRYFEQVMKQVKGRIYGPDGAAAILGLKPTTLQSRLIKLGLR